MSKVADEAKAFGNFIRECNVEAREKITWPSRHELIGSVWVVGALILLLSAFVFVCDTALGQAMTALLKLGGN